KASCHVPARIQRVPTLGARRTFAAHALRASSAPSPPQSTSLGGGSQMTTISEGLRLPLRDSINRTLSLGGLPNVVSAGSMIDSMLATITMLFARRSSRDNASSMLMPAYEAPAITLDAMTSRAGFNSALVGLAGTIGMRAPLPGESILAHKSRMVTVW